MTNSNQLPNIEVIVNAFGLNPPSPQEEQRMKELLQLMESKKCTSEEFDNLPASVRTFQEETHDSETGHPIIPYPLVLLKMVRAEKATGTTYTDQEATMDGYLRAHRELIEKSGKGQVQLF
jgi:hypothetical protein